jgi:(2R)-ethylmalonyl-CoA mutase
MPASMTSAPAAALQRIDRDISLADPDLCRPLDRQGVERALSRQPRQGADRPSVAFDLPTQTGYDSDHVLARGEVGKVGVPVSHLGDMRTLFDEIPLEQMNTSMTINATAPWLLALYIAVAEEQGADVSKLQGTVQNDLIKEYLSRGTYICPPKPSLKMIADVAAYTATNVPKWNPMNVCSYHLQEAGATPEQELAFALATAIAVLDELRPRCRRRISRRSGRAHLVSS